MREINYLGKIYKSLKKKIFLFLDPEEKILEKLDFNFNKKETFFQKIIYAVYNNKSYINLAFKIWSKYIFFNKKSYILQLIFSPVINKYIAKDEPLIQAKKLLIQSRKKNKILKCEDNYQIEYFYKNGYLELSNLLSFEKTQCNAVCNFFLSQKSYGAQVPIQSNLKNISIPNAIVNNINYLSYTPDISLKNKYIKSIVNNKKIKDLIDKILGFKSQIYSINTMLTLPCQKSHGVTNWHRDYDDIPSLALFIYWTETDAMNGATQYKSGSHCEVKGEEVYLKGKEGSIFILDPLGLHKGNKNLKKFRLATWIRYGRIPNNSYILDKNYLFL